MRNLCGLIYSNCHLQATDCPALTYSIIINSIFSLPDTQGKTIDPQLFNLSPIPTLSRSFLLNSSPWSHLSFTQ